MSDPALTRLGDGSLAMWFSAGGDQGGPLIARARLGSDLSATLEPGGAVFAAGASGAWDRFVETVSALRDSASRHVRLFYLGYADTGYVSPAIGMSVSSDSAGTHFERSTAPIYRPTAGAWDATLVTGPSAVRGPDGVWRVYYAGAGTTIGIGLLMSSDGVHWTPHAANPVFERRLGEWDESVLEPCVRYLHGRWYLWYSGYREPLGADTRIGIGLATSDDGVHWSRVGNGPVIAPGADGTWYSHRVLSPDVLEQPDGTLLLAAYGMTRADVGTVLGRIGLWRSGTPAATAPAVAIGALAGRGSFAGVVSPTR